MEGIPKPIQEVEQESVAKIEKAQVWEALRTKGLEAPGVRELVEQWTIQQEERVAKGTSRDAIILNIDRADLYIAVGDRIGALECLEDARRQAFQENENELTETIEDMMAGIEM